MTRTYFERFLAPWYEFDRMTSLLNKMASNSTCEFPAVNVWVNGDEALVTSELPGVDVHSIDISVSGDTVTLQGSRPTNERKEGESYHRHELWHGDFNKKIQLPFQIDADKVHASYKKGILHISLPQLESNKPKKVEIKSE